MAIQAFVRALVDGVFNDPDHRAQKVAAGTYLTVAGGWYVEELIKSGLVERANEHEVRQRIPSPNKADRVAAINDQQQYLREWREGDNMQGVGPHVEGLLVGRENASARSILDQIADRLGEDSGQSPFIAAAAADQIVAELKGELLDLDRALAEAEKAEKEERVIDPFTAVEQDIIDAEVAKVEPEIDDDIHMPSSAWVRRGTQKLNED